MLTAYSTSRHAEESYAAPTVSWIDLLNPTSEERASAERSIGFGLPSREELSEVELSSRISEKGGVLFLSMPIVAHVSGLDQMPTPLGFVLSRKLLVTIRYAQLRSFDTVAESRSKNDGHFSSVETFAALVDGMLEM